MLSDLFNQLNIHREKISRLGECWPGGPLQAGYNINNDITNYLEKIKILENRLKIERVNIIRIIRRLHYSQYDRRIENYRRGLRLDRLLAGKVTYPLVWSSAEDDISPQFVDELYQFTHLLVSTEARNSVEVAALFTCLEAKLFGASELGLIAENYTETPFEGITTWIGELSVLFLRWNQKRIMAINNHSHWDGSLVLKELQEQVCSCELILGYIDGQNIAQYLYDNIRESYNSIPNYTKVLEDYYADSVSDEITFNFSKRFFLFLNSAIPNIPHETNVISKSAAQEKIAQLIERTVIFFISHSMRDNEFAKSVDFHFEFFNYKDLQGIIQDVSEQSSFIHEIANQFVGFIENGLADPNQILSWPNTKNL